MATLTFKKWIVEVGSPIRVHKPARATLNSVTRPFDTPVHRDPTPTPGAFEPPIELFRVIARGERGLD